MCLQTHCSHHNHLKPHFPMAVSIPLLDEGTPYTALVKLSKRKFVPSTTSTTLKKKPFTFSYIYIPFFLCRGEPAHYRFLVHLLREPTIRQQNNNNINDQSNYQAKNNESRGALPPLLFFSHVITAFLLTSNYNRSK